MSLRLVMFPPVNSPFTSLITCHLPLQLVEENDLKKGILPVIPLPVMPDPKGPIPVRQGEFEVLEREERSEATEGEEGEQKEEDKTRGILKHSTSFKISRRGRRGGSGRERQQQQQKQREQRERPKSVRFAEQLCEYYVELPAGEASERQFDLEALISRVVLWSNSSYVL